MEKPKLTSKQIQALDLLLSGHRTCEVVTLANVSERQLYRWLASESFRLALKEGQSRLIEQAGSRLLALTEQALDTLQATLDNPGRAGANVARLAAVSILDQALKWREVNDLEARITALEERLKP